MGRRLPLSLRGAMAYAADMGRSSPPPECYYWSSVWWRLQAKESANPREPLTYSRNLFRLYRHMRANPDSYRRRLGARSATDWQIFREITRVAEPAQQAQGQGGE